MKAYLRAFDTLYGEIEIPDGRPQPTIELVHRKPLDLADMMSEQTEVSEPTTKRAIFEWRGKYGDNHSPIYDFIELR